MLGQSDACPQRKGAAYVAAAADPIEFGLCLGAARALKHVLAQRHIQRARQRLGKFQRLFKCNRSTM